MNGTYAEIKALIFPCLSFHKMYPPIYVNENAFLYARCMLHTYNDDAMQIRGTCVQQPLFIFLSHIREKK